MSAAAQGAAGQRTAGRTSIRADQPRSFAEVNGVGEAKLREFGEM
ncbi:hypothetical protein [Mesorhizobium sp.]|nr:hypothetical protein [Mesorhizobium sp.]